MTKLQSLTEEVRNANVDEIRLPILRNLVRDVQTKTPAQLREGAQHWSDKDWKQWRQHSSHNPW